MKTLYILRHAKSDWDAPYGGDHERPLNKRGVRSATLAGRFLAATGELPDAVLASTAVRARTTAELVCEAAGLERVATTRSRALYESHPPRVVEEIRKTPDEVASLLVAGHEPTSSGLVRKLTGGDVRMVTAALVRIDLAVERWADVEPDPDERQGEIVFMVPPRLLQKVADGDFR